MHWVPRINRSQWARSIKSIISRGLSDLMDIESMRVGVLGETAIILMNATRRKED